MPNKEVLASKKQAVKDVTALINASQIGVLVDYRGLSVAQDTELRNKLRAAGVKYSVVKNTTIRFALEDVNLPELDSSLHGPTAIATSESDLIAPAKVLFDFAKENEELEIKAGFMDGKVVDAATIKKLATLPPKEVLISKMLGSLQSPIAGFANVLNANITGLVRVLDQISKKQAS
jgi:large subunit ribosomal protein L10